MESPSREARTMQRTRSCSLVVALAVSALTCPAGAHVRYRDLDGAPTLVTATYGGTAIADPCAGAERGCQSSNAFTRWGWLKGTEASLGDSHFLTLNAEFWRFHLDAPASVTISFAQGQAGLDPAFSVYEGLLPPSGHDDTTVDPLNPVDDGGCAVASPTDARSDGATYTVHDGFRDTAAFSTLLGLDGCVASAPFFGQFDALASFSMANPSGAWSRIRFVAAVAAAQVTGNDGGQFIEGNHSTGAGTGETVTLALADGDYTIAAGGEACANSDGACGAILYGTVSIAEAPLGGSAGASGDATGVEADNDAAGATGTARGNSVSAPHAHDGCALSAARIGGSSWFWGTTALSVLALARRRQARRGHVNAARPSENALSRRAIWRRWLCKFRSRSSRSCRPIARAECPW